jgi:RNA polymerase sigma factor (sigma-70 family)
MTAAEKDDQAEQLVVDHWRLAQRLAAKWSRRYPALREELEADIVLALWRLARTHRADGRASFSGRLSQVARWVFLKHVNRIKNDNARLHQVQLEDTPLDEITVATTPPAGHRAEIAEEYTAAMRLIDQLPTHRRSQVIDHAVNGMTFRELAARRGVSVTCVAVRVAKDLERIRQQLLRGA